VNAATTSVPLTDKSELLSPFSAAQRPDPSTHLIGTELEKFGVVIPEGDALPTAVTYEDHVRPVLEGLVERFGWAPGHDRGLHGELVELTRDGASITLEPGGQLELSGKPLENVHQTCAEFTQHYRELHAVSEPLRIAWMTVGHQPWATREDIHWMPKGRYAVMRAYLPTRGTRGLDMMLRTSTVQANFDYASEAQCRRRLRLAAFLSPVLVALFANSPFLEGKWARQASVRAGVWLDVDPDRCGIPDFMVDGSFTYERYVDWALDVPTFFVKRDGIYHPHHVPFRSFMENGFTAPDGTHHRATANDWTLHMSTVFPEVRLKPYIEVRSADAVTSKYVCGLPAFLKGLLYDDDAGDGVVERLAVKDAATLLSRRREAFEVGLMSPELQALAREMLDLARRALDRFDVRDDKGRTEARFLDPLEAVVDAGRSPGTAVREDLGDEPGRGVQARRAFAKAFYFAGYEP
jgi:glutamate--cysteine ligase